MATKPTEYNLFQKPALCVPLDPVDLVSGQRNLNTVWSAEVIETEGPLPGSVYRCVFKNVAPETLPVELACALTGSLLGNDVPRPCLVWAGHEHTGFGLAAGPPTLMFGSTYIGQDSFFEHLSNSPEFDSALAQAVWGHFCNEAQRAALGASFDELVSNFDRHVRNLRFDGKRWWLIDHDNCLRECAGAPDLGLLPAHFSAYRNQIAEQLLDRRRHDHGLEGMARRTADQREKLVSLAAVAARWSHDNARVNEVLARTACLISLLARRLPMLQQLVSDRIGRTNPAPLSWPPTTPPPT